MKIWNSPPLRPLPFRRPSGPKVVFPVNEALQGVWWLLLSFLINGAGTVLLIALDYDGRLGNAFVNSVLALVAAIAFSSGYYCRRIVRATWLESVVPSLAVPLGYAVYLWDRVPAFVSGIAVAPERYSGWVGAFHLVIFGFVAIQLILFTIGWYLARRKEYPPPAFPRLGGFQPR